MDFKISFKLLFSLIIVLSLASAHVPKLVMNESHPEDQPLSIPNPEISKAYYGELNGGADYYKIQSDKPFRLYVNLLVPDLVGSPRKAVSLEVTDFEKNQLLFLDGENFTWTSYFEEFGGDYYLRGPESKLDLLPGTYYIKVYNSENKGKYSIAVGETESFSIPDSISTLLVLPQLKEKFFGKPVLLLFLHIMALIVAVGAVTITDTRSFVYVKERDFDLPDKMRNYARYIMWIGIVLALVTWIFIYLQNPLNILGIVKTLLFIFMILNELYIYNFFCMSFQSLYRLPLISNVLQLGIISRVISFVGWWLIVFITVLML